MTTIKLKNGSGAPLSSDLVQGEPAFDLTNKRLYTENSSGTVIEIGTSPSTIDINAGTIDGTVIGGTSAAAGTFTNLTATGTSTISTADINGGNIDGTVIGASSAAAGTFSTVTATGNVTGANLNISNWNTAYNDKINSAAFNTSTGVLTLTQQDAGTVTVDLDGKYGSIEYTTFTPIVTDESGNAGSIGSAYGYAARFIDASSTVVGIYFLIKAQNINTSGLVSTDNIQLSNLPSGYRASAQVSQEIPCGTAFNISLRSTGATLSGYAGTTSDAFRFRSFDGTGSTDLKVSAVSSGSGTILISGVMH